MKQDKILIIGAGAIGSFYGAILSKAGAEVAVVCKSDYKIVKTQGYSIKSNALGHWQFKPSQVLLSASDYNEEADYIILCTKVTPEIDRVKLIKAAVSKNTTIVFIQNGVGIEQELLDAFPINQIISGLAFICCNRQKPAETLHLAYGKLTIGSLNKPELSNKTQHLANLISSCGIETLVTENIISSRWLKCLWNASFNPLSVLSGGLSTQKIISSQEALIRTIMQEVTSIAEAYGHTLPANSIDINIEHTFAMPAYKTSMLLDFEKNKTMETEVILGNAVRAAKTKHIPCPTLETLYALLKLKELHHQQ